MTVHILSLAYANQHVFRAGMAYLRGTVDFEKLGVQHLVLDQHYPLRPYAVGDALAEYWGQGQVQTYDEGRNVGLHEGLNVLLSKIDLKDEDIVVGIDPDDGPRRKGWLEAMIRVFGAGSKAGWLSLVTPQIIEVLDERKAPVVTLGGEHVRFVTEPLMNVVVGWRGSTLKAMGKMEEPHNFYGGLESAMQPKCMAAGYAVGYMVDYFTDSHRHLADEEYEIFKTRHVGFTQPVFPGSFEDFLKEKP